MEAIGNGKFPITIGTFFGVILCYPQRIRPGVLTRTL
jgi:hypothetical protein